MVEQNQHLYMLQQIDVIMRPNPAVCALLVVGSVARAAADRWSDLDVIVVVTDDQLAAFDPATRWIGVLGEILAVECYPAVGRATTRAWLSSGRVDIIVATETCFGQEDGWPLWDGFAVCFSRSSIVDRVLAQPQQHPASNLLTGEGFDELVNQFWFQALMGLTKVVRGDLLIGLHLCLEAVQTTSVLAMALRDRATGTSIHRTGGLGNQLAQQLRLPQPIPTAVSILECLRHTSQYFDELAQTWSPDYHPRFPEFVAWLADTHAAV